MQSGTSELIETSEALEGLLTPLKQGSVCAIDTEADSLHRFRESLCLIQFACGDSSVLIDPLSVPNLESLKQFLLTSTVWMHGADYDMTMLRREFASLPPLVYDTQIGARLLGLRKFGLANLVEHYFGVTLSKSSQKADWGKRPLSSKMVEYALNDVRYLLPMGGKIVEELKEKGRFEWFTESCEAARIKVLERDESKEEPWRIQGAGCLDRRGLNMLKHLWEWRNAEAEGWDRPSFMVATNRQLIDWAMTLSAGRKPDTPSHFRSDRRRRLDECIAAAAETDPAKCPTKIKGLRRRRDGDFDKKVADLIAVRDRRAADLNIEGSLIASRSVLELLAEGEGSPGELLLGWQRELLGLD